MKPSNILILPGWRGSGPRHWQSLWVERNGYVRVDQHDWNRPLRGDWMARLEDLVLSRQEPAVLVAHNIACILVAAWSARSANTARVKAALLVAPLDTERTGIRDQLPTWSPIELQALAFPSVLVASRNDPHCGFDRARLFAHAWGAQFMDHGASGQIDDRAGLGSWPEGHVLLQDLMKD